MRPYHVWRVSCQFFIWITRATILGAGFATMNTVQYLEITYIVHNGKESTGSIPVQLRL